MNSVWLLSVLSMGGIGLFFSILIALANKKLHVEEDPRIGQIAELLPNANCGACGYAGCAAFAQALVIGGVSVNNCPVSSADIKTMIAQILGVNVETGERQVAVVFCTGGDGIVAQKAEYHGIATCAAANLVGGGERACLYGCLGLGDCVRACPFDAIHMDEKRLPVVDREKCTGCGNCVAACPRGVIELHPISRHVFVLCKNEDSPKVARNVCKNACIGCGICERAVNGQGFKVVNNLARVDHQVYTKELVLPTEKCPTKCIVIVGHADER